MTVVAAQKFVRCVCSCLLVSLFFVTSAVAEDVTDRLIGTVLPTPLANRSRFSSSSMMSGALGPAELVSLRDRLGMNDCFSGERDPADVSSAGHSWARECVREREMSHFRNADVMASRGDLLVGNTGVIGPRLTWEEIAGGAPSRASVRLVSQLFDSPVLQNLFEGRVDLSFSPSDLVRLNPDVRKPVYEVVYSSEDTELDGLQLASTGLQPELIRAAFRTKSHLPHPVDKRIIETWPSTGHPVGDVGEESGLWSRVQQSLGLTRAPLSQLVLRIERRGVEENPLKALSLRLIDTSGIGHLDFSEVVRGESTEILWALSLPFSAHRVGLVKTSSLTDTQFTYSYQPSSTLTASLSWRVEGAHEYAAGVIYSF